MHRYQKSKNGTTNFKIIYQNHNSNIIVTTSTRRKTHKSTNCICTECLNNFISLIGTCTYRSDIARRVMKECRSTPLMRKIDLHILADNLLEHRFINASEKKQITGEKTVSEGMDKLLDIMISSSRSLSVSGEVFHIFLDLLKGRGTKRTNQLADQLLQKYESSLFDYDAKKQAQFDGGKSFNFNF